MADLEDLYREIILDHYRSPRHRGELNCPPAHKTEGFNPLCGDEVIVYLQVEDGRISDLKTNGQGCSISQSSASLMSSAVIGKTLEEVNDLALSFKTMLGIEVDGEAATVSSLTDMELGDMEALRGVMKFPVRIKCAVLGWNTLLEGIKESAENSAS